MNPSYFCIFSPDEPSKSSAVRAGGGGFSLAARLDELERENANLREQLRHQTEVAAGLMVAREKTEEASRMKGEFVAHVSEEIRSALGGILGLANQLLETPLTTEQRELLHGMGRSGEGLVTLLNELLDFSKIEAGCVALEIADFNIREELQRAFELKVPLAARKGLQFILHLDPALPVTMRGDRLRLRQMVLNLLGNAVKFTERGGVVLRVRYEPACPQGRLRCEITDTGIGIPLAAQAGLFQPFRPADAATPRRFGGTGLGLAICKRLAALMQGEIGVRSAPGVGSTFWFSVDLAEAVETVTREGGAVAPVDLAGRAVLIVDPDAGCRHGLEDLCDTWKMHCEVADSAAMALAQLRWARQKGLRYDVVLLDHLMQGVDGLELARLIASEAEIAGPALVMLTAGSCPPESELVKSGLTVCVPKPVHPEKLRQTLSQALAQKQVRGAG